MLKLKFAFAFLSFILLGSSTQAQNTRETVNLNKHTQLLVGEWKLVLMDERNENGGPVSDEELAKRGPLQNFFSLSSDTGTEENKTIDYDERLIFNSDGELFLSVQAYGTTYSLSDSTLKIGNSEYKLLELNDSNLIFIDKPQRLQFFEIYTRRSFKRVNHKDSANYRNQMKNLLPGNWLGVEVQAVQIEGQIYYGQSVQIVDTLTPSIDANLNLKVDTETFLIETQEGMQVLTFSYDIADRQILNNNQAHFIILEISPSELRLLGPFQIDTQTSFIQTFRKLEM